MQAEEVVDKKGKPTGKYTFNATGANRALELLGKKLGMFVDRGETPVQFNSLKKALAAMPTDVLDREIARLQAEQDAKNAKPKPIEAVYKNGRAKHLPPFVRDALEDGQGRVSLLICRSGGASAPDPGNSPAPSFPAPACSPARTGRNEGFGSAGSPLKSEDVLDRLDVEMNVEARLVE